MTASEITMLLAAIERLIVKIDNLTLELRGEGER